MNSLSGEGSFIPTISPGNAAKTFTYAHGIEEPNLRLAPVREGIHHFKCADRHHQQRVAGRSYDELRVRHEPGDHRWQREAVRAIISPHSHGLSKPCLLGYEIAADITGSLPPSTTRQPLRLSRAPTQRAHHSLSGAWPPG